MVNELCMYPWVSYNLGNFMVTNWEESGSVHLIFRADGGNGRGGAKRDPAKGEHLSLLCNMTFGTAKR